MQAQQLPHWLTGSSAARVTFQSYFEMGLQGKAFILPHQYQLHDLQDPVQNENAKVSFKN